MIILVRLCMQVFETFPNHIPGLQKNVLFIYLIEQNVNIFKFCSLTFILPLFCL